jgi:tungstate transport system ATP-binding protein
LYTLNRVRHGYDGRSVLDIEEMSVRRGEILAIVGPSGSGKSTLLRLLDFLEAPNSGQLVFDGQPVSADIALTQRRRVTTVFQQPVLLKRSVGSNLRFGLMLRGQKLSNELRDHWLERLGLSELANKPADRLSAGEGQRVALARALLVQPDVLLLDEPTANLDPYNVDLIESIVQEENRLRGTTIVMVTHQLFQARRLAHRTALLLGGRFIEIADTDTFFESPRSPETAAFVRGELVY